MTATETKGKCNSLAHEAVSKKLFGKDFAMQCLFAGEKPTGKLSKPIGE